MATKTALTTAINTYITAVITQLKLRNGFLELINALFQTTTLDSDTSGTNKFQYRLRYKKIGNLVWIDGWVQNKYSISKSSINLVTIPDSLYFAKSGIGNNTMVVQPSISASHLLSIADDNIYLTDTIAPDEKIYINAHYQTND